MPSLSALQAVEDMGYENASIQTFGASGNRSWCALRQVSTWSGDPKQAERGHQAAFGDELVSYGSARRRVDYGGAQAPRRRSSRARPQRLPWCACRPAARRLTLATCQAAAPAGTLQFKMGDDGKPVRESGGAPAKDRLVLAQDSNAAPAADAPAADAPAAPAGRLRCRPGHRANQRRRTGG